MPNERDDRDDPGPGLELGVRGIVVVGRPGSNLGRGLVDRHRQDRRRLELLRVRASNLGPPSREELFGEGLEGRQPLGLVVHALERPEGHHRLVVRRVLEGRARQDEPVDDGHRHTGSGSLGQGPHRAARGRAVDVEPVAEVRVEHRDATRVAPVEERDVGQQTAAQDAVDRGPVVAALRRPAPHSDAIRNVVTCLRQGSAMVVAARHDGRIKGENGGYREPCRKRERAASNAVVRPTRSGPGWTPTRRSSEADEATPLGAEDLELLATSASMVGRMDDYLALLERAHHLYADAGEELRAARMAGWIGMNLAIRGEMGPAGGWFGRSQRLVEGVGKECVEQGYLLVPVAFQQQAMGDFDAAYDAAAGATEIGRRFGEADLCALAGHIQGLVRIKQNRVEEGLGLLDEAMVAVTAGEVSPVLSGVVYCGVIACCEEAFEPRRAREWTDALARWCEQQPQMVAFTGRCLAHRAGIMQLHGAWQDALAGSAARA